MRAFHGVVLVWILTSGCSSILGVEPVQPPPDSTPPDSTPPRSIGGHVSGLWNGTGGVTLRLESDGVSARLTVPYDGDFRFEEQLAPGAAFTVMVADSPVLHTCAISGGGAGTVADADIMNVAVMCSGPPVQVTVVGGWKGTFDATQSAQRFSGSVVAQDASLVISGASLIGAALSGVPVPLGVETPPITLPLGVTGRPLVLTAQGGLTKTYQLEFERGAAVLEQAVYGKASNAGSGDSLGYAIALSGDTLAVSAPNEDSGATGVNGNQLDESASGSGAVYVFVRSAGVWAQQAYLKPSNTGIAWFFGASVALSGDTLAVGAAYEPSAATGINGDQFDSSLFFAGAVYVFVRSGAQWSQQAYVKASNTNTGDFFGYSVALSGTTLAVGALGEDSRGPGLPLDNSAANAGAVYVFTRTGATWTQQAYLKASNAGAGDSFGTAVALSGDTLVVGAPFEDSAATGVNGNSADESAADSGAAYVFVRTGTSWSQQAYVKASNTGAGDAFGSAAAVSGDTLAVGAPREASVATGVGGNAADNSAAAAGAVYVFARSGAGWTEQAYVKPSNTGAGDTFGSSVALSGDTLAVGARAEASSSAGIDGDQTDNGASGAGAAYVFVHAGAAWSQRAYVKASNPGAGDQLGFAVALSEDTLAIGAVDEDSAAQGPNGNQTDNSASGAGAIYVFR